MQVAYSTRILQHVCNYVTLFIILVKSRVLLCIFAQVSPGLDFEISEISQRKKVNRFLKVALEFKDKANFTHSKFLKGG